MNEKEYEKLNYYLNGCFKELEKKDNFLLRNIEPLAGLSDAFVNLTKQYEFKVYKDDKYLTFEEVYLLAREIVASINPNYLSYYDDLIKSGKIDFDYDSVLIDSSFFYDTKSGIKIIDIKRNFNYTDVSSLIHEFMHYMACLDDNISINRYILTEAISIYFEEYAKNYLIDKGISEEKVFLNERIISSKHAASNFNWYSLILLAYEKFGKIGENTYKLLSKYYLEIIKEAFQEECQKTLNKLSKMEEECKDEYKTLMIENENLPNYEEFLFENLTNLLNHDYRYILGTYIAYYALEHTTLDKMVYLCDNINKFPFSNMGIIELLSASGIDVDQLDIDIIKKQLDKNNTKRRKI